MKGIKEENEDSKKEKVKYFEQAPVYSVNELQSRGQCGLPSALWPLQPGGFSATSGSEPGECLHLTGRTLEMLDLLCLPFLSPSSLNYFAGSPHLQNCSFFCWPIAICIYSPKVEAAISGSETVPIFLSGPLPLRAVYVLLPLYLTFQWAIRKTSPT